MRPSALTTKVVVVGVALVAVLIALGATTASAAEPSCHGSVLYTAAHEDDTLLFESPDLLRDIESGRCVVTIFLTAGDAGRAEPYWVGREEGAEASYAAMAEVADEWEASTVAAAGHEVRLMTLKQAPRIKIVFMRLPDGSVEGEGWERYGFQSLMKLWNGVRPPAKPAINSMTTVDGSQAYSYNGLIRTLAVLINTYEPTQIATQNFDSGFFEGDHQDHIATGYFIRAASLLYAQPHRLLAYVGYPTYEEAENVFGELLELKSFPFYTYGADDSDACTSAKSCSETPYASWLSRQYVAGTETTGVVADAGYGQTSWPELTVELNGSESSGAGGAPLRYAWTQTGGPAVKLVDADTATPTFVAPDHPTLLTFSLTVAEELTESAPDTVLVRLPSSEPNPVAVVGPEQTVDSGAAVSLEGSESFDPNSLPLTYEWQQTAGPTVVLSDSTTAMPSFVAPTGPVELEFSLVVSNGSENSDPATVKIGVRGIAPSFTSEAEAGFTIGVEDSFTIETAGSPEPAITLASGTLPAGLELEDRGGGTATISGVPTAGTAAPGSSRIYSIELSAENSVATATQELELTVVAPPDPPAPEPPPPAGPVPPRTEETPSTPSALAPPSLPSLGTRYAFSGVPLNLPITAAGTPLPTLSLAASDPTGVVLRQLAPGSATLGGRFPAPGTKQVTVVVTNSVGSVNSTLTVVVVPPPRLSRALVAVPVGASSRRGVSVLSRIPYGVKCAGGLPSGARCLVRGGRVIVQAGPAVATGTYRLAVKISTGAGVVRRSLLVKVGPAR
jgi:LmbE family N-acetylglucosaminyl deacetylase